MTTSARPDAASAGPLPTLAPGALGAPTHGFVAESRLEAVGQVYLGAAPEFALVAL